MNLKKQSTGSWHWKDRILHRLQAEAASQGEAISIRSRPPFAFASQGTVRSFKLFVKELERLSSSHDVGRPHSRFSRTLRAAHTGPSPYSSGGTPVSDGRRMRAEMRRATSALEG